MESVPTPKKSWIQDGHVAQYPTALDGSGNVHGGTCTACHGGVDGTADKAAAHAGLTKIPGGDTCSGCHGATVALAALSLHTTVGGYQPILEQRGVDFTPGSTSRTRFDKQCTSCHVANSAGQAACGHCHVSVPTTAGGGFLAGHRFQATPSMDRNCTACHGSRVKDEYYGLNGALLARNLQYAAAIPADSPLRGVTLAPDVHKTAGMACNDCHAGTEMHGQGVTAGDDRYLVDGTPKCETCHPANAAFTGATFMHGAAHVSQLDCRVCHAQPYKSCYGCHTDVTATDVAFFSNNGTDPTRAARTLTSPAWSAATTYAKGAFVVYQGASYVSLQAGNLNHLPDEAGSAWWAIGYVAGDAQMQFRAGLNPRFGEAGQKRYAVLRHVPVDEDVFRYSGANAVSGLIPNLTAAPTWRYATPHSIARVTPIQASCNNCHAAAYAGFWLTDAVNAAFGWVGTDADAQQAETTANAGVVVPAPLPQ